MDLCPQNFLNNASNTLSYHIDIHKYLVLKVHSHSVATVAATTRKCCRYNWISLYLMDLFKLCGSGSGCSIGNASKWVPIQFLWLQQWRTNTVLIIICHCRKCSCEHFHLIAAEKPLPLPHRVNGPLLADLMTGQTANQVEERDAWDIQKNMLSSGMIFNV